MRRRWLIYVLIGLVFGIIDWYYLDLLQSGLSFVNSHSDINNAAPVLQFLFIVLIVVLNWGFWLIPVIPVAAYEEKRSNSIGLAVLSAIIVWSLAVLNYYLYYTVLLLFWGLPSVEFMLLSNRNSPSYWQDFNPLFQRLILDQFFDWIPIALFGGAIVGALTGVIYRHYRGRKSKRVTSQG